MTQRPRVTARIDWWKVIVDLERSMTLDQIAAAIDRKGGWVRNLKYTPGTDPKFHDGLMLIGLWKTSTGWTDGAPVPYEADLRGRADSSEKLLRGVDTAPDSPVPPPKDRPNARSEDPHAAHAWCATGRRRACT